MIYGDGTAGTTSLSVAIGIENARKHFEVKCAHEHPYIAILFGKRSGAKKFEIIERKQMGENLGLY